MHLSTFSSSVPMSSVMLPAIRKPPVVDSFVTEKPPFVSALQTAFASSLLTIAVIIFITIPPKHYRARGAPSACFHFSTDRTKNPLPRGCRHKFPVSAPVAAVLVLPGTARLMVFDLLLDRAEEIPAEKQKKVCQREQHRRPGAPASHQQVDETQRARE